MWVENFAAAEREAGRRLAQNEAVPGRDKDWAFQAQLQPALVARQQLLYSQKTYMGRRLGRAAEKVYGHVVAQGICRVGQQTKGNIEQPGRPQRPRGHYNLSAADFIGGDAAEIHSHPAARQCPFDALLVRLQCAHAARRPVGKNIDRFAHRKMAVAHRAGHDGAEAGQAEDAVDGQPRAAAIAAGGQRRQGAGQS